MNLYKLSGFFLLRAEQLTLSLEWHYSWLNPAHESARNIDKTHKFGPHGPLSLLGTSRLVSSRLVRKCCRECDATLTWGRQRENRKSGPDYSARSRVLFCPVRVPVLLLNQPDVWPTLEQNLPLFILSNDEWSRDRASIFLNWFQRRYCSDDLFPLVMMMIHWLPGRCF